MNLMETKIEFKNDEIYVDAWHNKVIPENLYLALEIRVKFNNLITQEDFEKTKVKLNDIETTVKRLKEGRWL